jgi:undecaprenyl diphosphate synthase
MQSDLVSKLHVAIIMDGNGRWATRRSLPRQAGHVAGADAIQRVAEAAPELGIGTITLYAFSADNWRRPDGEVRALMALLRRYLENETERLARTGARLEVIGRRDRLPSAIPPAIARAEQATAGGTALRLRIAVDYSARDAIIAAAAAARGPQDLTREGFSRLIAGAYPCKDVDLLIRTGGEQRLSDFLLWECAYAELYFTERYWPDFGAADLAEAMAWFRVRERRFGGLGNPPVAAA